jgi:hypothetical protein
MTDEPFRPVLVRGQSGGGKSALLANWVAGWSQRHRATTILVHHLGCGADAADPERMEVRLIREIARLTGDKGDFDGAEILYRRALEGREKALGPGHPATLRCVYGL